MAGKPIFEAADGSGSWKAVLEAVQSDLDYLRLMFNLTRTSSHQLFCHYCDSIQWLSNRSEIGPLNNKENLYTIYGPRESDHPNLCEHIPALFVALLVLLFLYSQTALNSSQL